MTPGLRNTRQLIASIRQATLMLKAESSTTRLRLAADRFADLLAKANFDPGQPRVPHGNPRGGRWTRVGIDGGSSAEALVGGNGPDDLGKPRIPNQRPPTAKLRNTFVKQAARWVLRGGKLALRASPIGRVIDVVEAGLWIWDHWDYIQAYQDEPKTLEELQRAVSEPKPGYDIHHVVERAAARAAGYTREEINAPENLIRIPTLKHWEINGWYATPNEAYGGLTPRVYLRGKDWKEQQEVGNFVLRRYGVLK